VLHDEVGVYLLQSESEESLSGSEFDTGNELDDYALLDVVLNDGNIEDNIVTQDFVWKNMQNCKDRGKISWALLDFKVLQNM
jgi:hypothetical protein